MTSQKMKRRLLLGCLALPGIPVLLTAVLLGGFFVQGCSPPPALPPLLDQDGRIVLYHGVNVSNYSKYAPDFHPWQTREDFALLADWGFNLVRYLVFWEAIEPERGHYNEAYLDEVMERIGWFEALGIDVLLDLHQDLYARPFGGDGFPGWTINDGGHAFVWREPWNLNYLSPAVLSAYRHFWQSADLRGSYIAMVSHLLRRVEGRKNVIGLDIMNEPWPAPFCGFERKVLSRFYEDVHAMRRREGYSTRLFFEPVIYTSTGWPSRLRFTPDPDSVYAPHYYDPLCHEGRPYTALGKRLMRKGVHIKMKEASRFGVPLLYGEFGVGPNVKGYDAFLGDFLGLLRQHHIGWTCYSLDKSTHSGFGLYDENGAPRYALLRHYVSVYPQRVAGRNLETRYEKNGFFLAYDPIETDAPTIIAIPNTYSHAHVWVNGVEVPFSPELRRFAHRIRPAEGRQTIEVRWTGP